MCRVVTSTFPAAAQTPEQARRWTDGWLDAWELLDPDGAVVLMVSELVTNAVRYAGTPITVTLAVAEGVTEIGVADLSWPATIGRTETLRPARRAGAGIALAEGGRGLLIVDALADDWGVTPVGEGKQVWFRRRIATRWPYADACVCHGEDLTAQRLASGRRAVVIQGPWDGDRGRP